MSRMPTATAASISSGACRPPSRPPARRQMAQPDHRHADPAPAQAPGFPCQALLARFGPAVPDARLRSETNRARVLGRERDSHRLPVWLAVARYLLNQQEPDGLAGSVRPGVGR